MYALLSCEFGIFLTVPGLSKSGSNLSAEIILGDFSEVFRGFFGDRLLFRPSDIFEFLTVSFFREFSDFLRLLDCLLFLLFGEKIGKTSFFFLSGMSVRSIWLSESESDPNSNLSPKTII